MTKILFYCFLGLLLLPVTCSGQLSKLQELKLDSIFMDWKPDTPGGAISVVHHGEIIFRKAFGAADLEKNLANTPELKYDLASNAKQFTAMCIALLEEQGKLSSDDNLKKYYPDLKITQKIKIKNLLDHTSGLRDASVLAILSGKMNLKGEVRKKYNTKAYYLECLMRESDLNYDVGTEFAYNNFNYVLLGDIVEKVSGKTLAAFADSAIFKPLGMRNTLICDRPNMKITDAAAGYLFTGKKFKKRAGFGGNIVGDHNMVSNVDDLLKWQNNFIHNKLGKGNQQLIDKICTSSKLNNDTLTHYGYGIWIGSYKGQVEIGHGGDDGRYTSTLKRFPKHDLIVIALANSSRFDDTQKKAYQVVDVLLNDSLKQPVKKPEAFNFITLPESDLISRTGLYTYIDKRGLGQLAKIIYRDGSLYVGNYFRQNLKLSPVSSQHFIGKNDAGKIVDLQFGEASDTTYVLENFNNNPTRRFVQKKESVVPYHEYVGYYKNESTGAGIKIRKKKGKIVARKGILRIPLVHFAKDQFYAPENDALFIFNRDANGSVTSFKANAYDFRNFNFDKK